MDDTAPDAAAAKADAAPAPPKPPEPTAADLAAMPEADLAGARRNPYARSAAAKPEPDAAPPAAKPEPAIDTAAIEDFKRARAELEVELARAREHNERTRKASLLSHLKSWGAIDIGDQHLLALAPKDADPQTPEGLAKLDKWAKGEGARLFIQKGPSQAETLEAAAKKLKPADVYKGPHDEAYATRLLQNVAQRRGVR